MLLLYKKIISRKKVKAIKNSILNHLNFPSTKMYFSRNDSSVWVLIGELLFSDDSRAFEKILPINSPLNGSPVSLCSYSCYD
jgi:hypothetical protein